MVLSIVNLKNPFFEHKPSNIPAGQIALQNNLFFDTTKIIKIIKGKVPKRVDLTSTT